MKRLIFSPKGYHCFELLLVAALTILVSITLVLTKIHPGCGLFHALEVGLHKFGPDLFVSVSGAFMAVLMALELNHTVLPKMSSGKQKS